MNYAEFWWGMWQVQGEREVRTEFWWVNLRERTTWET